MTHIFLPHRQPKGRCRVCKQLFFTESQEQIGRHTERCGREHYEKTHADRSKLDFMKPWDPEHEAWMKREYEQGRIKPSTERLG